MRKLNPFITLALIVFGILIFLPAKAALVGSVSQATLSVSPQVGNFNAGDTIPVSVYLNTNGQNVVVVAAYLYYDKKYFEAVSIETAASIFNTEAEKVIDSANGKIKITRGIPTPGVITSNGLVAKINLKALSSVTPSGDNLIFAFMSGSTIESNVILDDGKGTDILNGVYNAKYTIGSGGPISYSNGSLLRASDSDKIYLIEDNEKHWVPSAEVFKAKGYPWSSVVTVDPSVISQFPEGANVSVSGSQSSSIPEGALIRAKGDIDVYIVKYNKGKQYKRLILSPSVFNNYGHLKWSDIKDVDQSVVDSFTTADLVRAANDPKVYKLYPSGDTGQKRWVKTADAFTRMGFDWDAIYEINSFDRDSYIEGAALE